MLGRNQADDSKNVLGGGSSIGKDAGSSGFSLVGDSSLAAFADVKLEPSEDEGEPRGGIDKLFGSDALQLSDDELKVMDPGSTSKGKAKPPDSQRSSGSSIKLGDEELEVVLGSKTGSDVTQSPTDSGIQLISPSDSGLSLDRTTRRWAALHAVCSTCRSMIWPPWIVAAEEVPGLKPDEDFMLTAMDDVTEESSDSGSQVIALDTDDELGGGMFAAAGGPPSCWKNRGLARWANYPRC